jgi:predicted ATPase
MSLSRETCELVAAAYRLGLVLEDIKEACGPADVLSDPLRFRPRLEAGIDELARLQGTTELMESLSLVRAMAAPPPFTGPLKGWGDGATQMLSSLQEHVAALVGPKLRDKFDALLILLFVEQRERGREQLRSSVELAPWIGVDDDEIADMIYSRSMKDLLYYPVPTRGKALTVRLTVDGRLHAEDLLEGSAEPGNGSASQSSVERAVSTRVDGSIERIEIRNIFSFGAEAEPIELGPLNILIGANGAGKSNVLEAIEILASTPKDIQTAIRDAGGIYDVLSRRTKQEGLVGRVEAVIRFADRDEPLRHRLAFTAEAQRFVIVEERIGNFVAPLKMPATRSILSERREPELADLAAFYEGIQSYREPLLGRLAPFRAPQATDLPNDRLLADGSNLALVLSQLRLDPPRMRSIVDMLQDVYASVRDIETRTQGGTIQVFLQDEGFPLSARRVSDGTMRFLCLLVVLSDPSPPPVVLIEEPELGLHPDAFGALADLLRAAAERTQLVVTTHCEALVDRFGDTPEAVLVVDKDEHVAGGSTRVQRLDTESLKEWLDKYSLGRLWRMGELGGNRW